MTLLKAIQLLSLLSRDLFESHHLDEANAVLLGQQALNRILYLRTGASVPMDYPLKGETSENASP